MNPRALENRPKLYDWMRPYINAFMILNRTRQTGMGLNPIQLQEILAYQRIFPDSSVSDFAEFILDMDLAWMEIHAKKQKQKSDSSNQGSK